MEDLVRIVVIAELGFVLALGTVTGIKVTMNRGWASGLYGAAMASLVLVVVLAVYVNILSPIPPTPGVKVLSATLVPVIGLLGVSAWMLRRPRKKR